MLAFHLMLIFTRNNLSALQIKPHLQITLRKWQGQTFVNLKVSKEHKANTA